MKTFSRIDDYSIVRTLTAVEVLLTNGAVKHSKNNIALLSPSTNKTNIAARVILYSLFDLLEEGERNVYHVMITGYVADPVAREKILERICYSIRQDAFEHQLRGLSVEELCSEVRRKINQLYQSNYESAFNKLGNVFFRQTRKRTSSGYHAHYLILTAAGRELRDCVREGYVF